MQRRLLRFVPNAFLHLSAGLALDAALVDHTYGVTYVCSRTTMVLRRPEEPSAARERGL